MLGAPRCPLKTDRFHSLYQRADQTEKQTAPSPNWCPTILPATLPAILPLFYLLPTAFPTCYPTRYSTRYSTPRVSDSEGFAHVLDQLTRTRDRRVCGSARTSCTLMSPDASRVTCTTHEERKAR